MSGFTLGWLSLVAIAIALWLFLLIRMIGRLRRQTGRAEEAGTPGGEARARALGGFFSDPSVMTERRQLLWMTILVGLLLLGGPLVGAR